MGMVRLTGTLNERYAKAIELAEADGQEGAMGVISPKFAVKASMQWRMYQQNCRTKVREFIKKFMVLEALHDKANQLREEAE
jgi:hypothetical protein